MPITQKFAFLYITVKYDIPGRRKFSITENFQNYNEKNIYCPANRPIHEKIQY